MEGGMKLRDIPAKAVMGFRFGHISDRYKYHANSIFNLIHNQDT